MATRRNMNKAYILCVTTYLIYTITVSTTGAVLIGTLYEIVVERRISERRSFEPSFIQNTAAKTRYHILPNYWSLYVNISRSRLSCGLWRRSTAARLLRLWVRIPPET
jgi:hypothetical protein